MYTLRAIGSSHPLYALPPANSVEHVYSAIEFTANDESAAYSVVCYRTKDGVTHQATIKDGAFTIRKSVSPFGK